MHNENELTETTAVVKNIDMMTAYKNLIAKVAEHGFTNEIDEDETGLPSHFMFSVDKHEIQRIIIERDYYAKFRGTTIVGMTIDRISLNPFSMDSDQCNKRTVFFNGRVNLADLDFVEKLVLSIFPKPVYPVPY